MGAGMSLPATFAVCVVRAWTRLYTSGLPPAQRTARLAEIESDLWELEHDPVARQRGNASIQILTRLLVGMPDDLAWRMEMAAASHAVPVRALAAAGAMTGPRRVSALGISATMHVIGITAVVWLTSHGYLYWRDANAATPEEADMWSQVGTFETGGESLAAPAEDAATATRPNRFIATLREHRYSLEVGDGYLLGTGAPVLQSAIRDSRFVMLGEDHGATSRLGAAMCATVLMQCASVLTKVDPLQVYRGLNPERGRGIGNAVALAAERQGLQSLHILVVAFNGSQDSYPRHLQLLLHHRLKQEWTLFDLRPLRHNFNALAGKHNVDLATLVFGIDMLVVVP
jgi:hypothetical protein